MLNSRTGEKESAGLQMHSPLGIMDLPEAKANPSSVHDLVSHSEQRQASDFPSVHDLVSHSEQRQASDLPTHPLRPPKVIVMEEEDLLLNYADPNVPYMVLEAHTNYLYHIPVSQRPFRIENLYVDTRYIYPHEYEYYSTVQIHTVWIHFSKHKNILDSGIDAIKALFKNPSIQGLKYNSDHFLHFIIDDKFDDETDDPYRPLYRYEQKTIYDFGFPPQLKYLSIDKEHGKEYYPIESQHFPSTLKRVLLEPSIEEQDIDLSFQSSTLRLEYAYDYDDHLCYYVIGRGLPLVLPFNCDVLLPVSFEYIEPTYDSILASEHAENDSDSEVDISIMD